MVNTLLYTNELDDSDTCHEWSVIETSRRPHALLGDALLLVQASGMMLRTMSRIWKNLKRLRKGKRKLACRIMSRCIDSEVERHHGMAGAGKGTVRGKHIQVQAV